MCLVVTQGRLTLASANPRGSSLHALYNGCIQATYMETKLTGLFTLNASLVSCTCTCTCFDFSLEAFGNGARKTQSPTNMNAPDRERYDLADVLRLCAFRAP